MMKNLNTYSVAFMMAVCAVSFSLNAQTILMAEDVNEDTIPDTNGPNLVNYWHTFMGYGLILGNSEGEGARTKPGLSYEFIGGIRYKRRINNTLGVGFDIQYGQHSFNIQQDSAKTLPNSELHDKEKLIYHNLGLTLYTRINFGKRGNTMGNFIDLGAYGDWGYIINHYTKDKHDTALVGASVEEVTLSRLVYTNPINHGVFIRGGISRYVVYAKYRLSNLFKEDYIIPYTELPRFIVGVEIGLYR